MPDELEDIQPDEEPAKEDEGAEPASDDVISDGEQAPAAEDAPASETQAEEAPSEEAPAEEESKDKKKRGRSTRLKSERRRAPKQDELAKSLLKGELRYRGFETICSECYEDFSLNPNIKLDKFNCPECDHASKTPDEEFLRKYYGAKEKEKFNLKVALIALGVLILIAFLWPIIDTNPNNQDSGGLTYGFFFLIFVGLVVLIWFGIRYEIKRYETYF